MVSSTSTSQDGNTDFLPDFGKRNRHQRAAGHTHFNGHRVGSTERHVSRLECHSVAYQVDFAIALNCVSLHASFHHVNVQCPHKQHRRIAAETHQSFVRLPWSSHSHRRTGTCILTDVLRIALPVRQLMRSSVRAPLLIHSRVRIQGPGLEVPRETIAMGGRQLGCVKCRQGVHSRGHERQERRNEDS